MTHTRMPERNTVLPPKLNPLTIFQIPLLLFLCALAILNTRAVKILYLGEPKIDAFILKSDSLYRDEFLQRLKEKQIMSTNLVDIANKSKLNLTFVLRHKFVNSFLSSMKEETSTRLFECPIEINDIHRSRVFIPYLFQSIYSIDESEIREFQLSDPDESEIVQFIKYGNFVKREDTWKEHFNFFGLALLMIVITLFASLVLFAKRYLYSTKNIIINKFQKKDDKFPLLDTPELFKMQLDILDKNSKDIFDRSTLMLILGLGIAVIGAISFYVFLPSFNEENTWEQYLVKSVRPVFVLIFIQSVSIFMLKQYRRLLDDYYSVRKLYEKRVNHLISFQISNGNKHENNLLLINALLKHEEAQRSELLEKDGENMNSVTSKIIDDLKKYIPGLGKE